MPKSMSTRVKLNGDFTVYRIQLKAIAVVLVLQLMTYMIIF
jgi:hypothetical protein